MDGNIHGGQHIFEEYKKFIQGLGKFCLRKKLKKRQLKYHDWVIAIDEWLSTKQ